jgi:hypothetical protein
MAALSPRRVGNPPVRAARPPKVNGCRERTALACPLAKTLFSSGGRKPSGRRTNYSIRHVHTPTGAEHPTLFDCLSATAALA